MAFNDIELAKIDRALKPLCKARTSPHIKSGGTVEYRIKAHEVLLYTRRPLWDNPDEEIELGVAKFKYQRTTNTWHLYWLRASLKWNGYEPFPVAASIQELADEVQVDPYGCFWG